MNNKSHRQLGNLLSTSRFEDSEKRTKRQIDDLLGTIQILCRNFWGDFLTHPLSV